MWSGLQLPLSCSNNFKCCISRCYRHPTIIDNCICCHRQVFFSISSYSHVQKLQQWGSLSQTYTHTLALLHSLSLSFEQQNFSLNLLHQLFCSLGAFKIWVTELTNDWTRAHHTHTHLYTCTRIHAHNMSEKMSS